MATAFSTQGATPFANPLAKPPANPANPFGSTPVAKALGNAQSPNFQTITGQNQYIPPYKPTTPSAPPAPSTPVKKTTINNMDGSSHTTEYHAPATPGILSSQTNEKPNPSYIPGSIGPGNTPILPSDTAPQNTPQTPQNASTATQTPVAPPSPFAPNAQPAATSAMGLLNTGTSQQKEAFDKAQALQAQLARSQGNEATTLANMQGNPIPIEFQQGRGNIVQGLYNSQQEALSSQLQGQSNLANIGATLAGQGQTGLLGAGQLSTPSNQFLQVPYSNQVLDAKGNLVTGAAGTLQDAVSTVVQRIQSGQMSYDQGVQALGGYGQGGVNALQQALGPGFNVSQSNALAGQQGTVGPAYNFAKKALENLQNTVKNLGLSQGTNIPIINAIGNLFSNTTGIGSDATRQYQGALAEARNAYAQLLAASRGGTPTDYGNQATAAIPDNATPNDITAAINNLESLGKAKVDIYGNPGASNTNTSTGGSSLYDF